VTRRLVLLTLALLGVSVAAPVAQSLGDLARVEQARRAAARPGKVYTADDLIAAPGRPASPPAVPAGSAPATAQAGIGTAGDPSMMPPVAPITSANPRPEAYWRTRARDLRALVAEARARAGALVTRLTDLDGQLERAASSAVTQERAVTFTALARAQRDLRSLEDARQAFETSAKAANVPSAWIE
jgi:hypothetical protein